MLRSLTLGVTLLVAGACTSNPHTATTAAKQLAFGVSMAQRELWSEALFRFEEARRLDPGDAHVLNNLAVAYEAMGRFDDALATYREALKAAPGDRQLKRNYTRFAEFYQSFHAKATGNNPPAGKPAAKPAKPPTGGAQ